MKIRELLNLIETTHKVYKTSKPYVCGGMPRDKYLGRLSSAVDIDITTGDKSVDNLSMQVFKTLRKKFVIDREVKSDGHSSIYFNNMKLDFSSNFNADNIEQHLAKLGINNPSSLQKEAFSRDFGCNSLLLSMDFKKIYDPTHRGFEDCDKKVIKTLLSPEATFSTNKSTGFNNRAIRCIYLACKLDFTIHPDIINYLSANPNIFELTEPTSLAKKLNKAYDLDPNKAVYYINKMNLWDYIPISNMLSDKVLDLLANRVSYAKKVK